MPEVRLVSHDGFVRAIDRASTIALSAYVLGAGSSVAAALERAGDRGAAVSVTLDGAPRPGTPAGDLDAATARVAAELRAHRVDVRLTTDADPSVHLKAAVVDHTAYLDDRNWPETGDTIVATSNARDVASVVSALAGHPTSNGHHLATEKAPALRLEARAIRGARGDHIEVETESFGGSAVSNALRVRAAGGTHVRLLVNARSYARALPAQRHTLGSLQAAGIEVRLGNGAEKLCVAGDRGWVGSTNASFAPKGMLDWGLSVRQRPLLADLERAFERTWARAEPLRAAESVTAV